MTLIDLLIGQLLDPFRIGLIVALAYTAGRTAGAVGVVGPLALGLVFVALIIPVTMPSGTEPLWRLVATGVVANVIILGIVLGLWRAYRRLRG